MSHTAVSICQAKWFQNLLWFSFCSTKHSGLRAMLDVILQKEMDPFSVHAVLGLFSHLHSCFWHNKKLINTFLLVLPFIIHCVLGGNVRLVEMSHLPLQPYETYSFVKILLQFKPSPGFSKTSGIISVFFFLLPYLLHTSILDFSSYHAWHVLKLLLNIYLLFRL